MVSTAKRGHAPYQACLHSHRTQAKHLSWNPRARYTRRHGEKKARQRARVPQEAVREGLSKEVRFEQKHEAPWRRCEGLEAAQNLAGLWRLEENGLQGKQLRRRLKGRPRQAHCEVTTMLQLGFTKNPSPHCGGQVWKQRQQRES